MKQKGSMLRAIVLRFIGYSLGTELANSILEEVFITLMYGAGKEFPYDGFPIVTPDMAPWRIALVALWGLLALAVYSVGIYLFARSVSRKLQEQFQDDEKERMQLFSNIAHDLKTPMTTITGYAGALADDVVEDADKQREYLLAIKAKSGQMNQLIDQLLSYSKMGAAQYQPNLSREDLTELVRKACAELFGEMENKQMELDLQLPKEPVFCMVDALELSRAIGNLLTNAIRHNPVGTLLFVGLTEDAERVTVQIADSGPAITEAIAKSMFEPFVSGNHSRSSGSGTGLGLAIVKKVMEQHSGEIALSDAPTPYTKTFVLHLPKK